MKQKETHRFRESVIEKLMGTTLCQRKEWGDGMVKKVGIDIYTLLYFKWITDEDLLYV